MITILKNSNLALSFLLELCFVVAFGYWGFRTGHGAFIKAVSGLGAPLLAILVWATFESPNAWIPLPEPWHLFLALAIFGLAAVALYAAGQPSLAVIFAVIVVINHILIYIWHQ